MGEEEHEGRHKRGCSLGFRARSPVLLGDAGKQPGPEKGRQWGVSQVQGIPGERSRESGPSLGDLTQNRGAAFGPYPVAWGHAGLPSVLHHGPCSLPRRSMLFSPSGMLLAAPLKLGLLFLISIQVLICKTFFLASQRP